ncbi:MAG: RHS repeat-associated core domain-containing protein [Pseudomonadota bacterium]
MAATFLQTQALWVYVEYFKTREHRYREQDATYEWEHKIIAKTLLFYNSPRQESKADLTPFLFSFGRRIKKQIGSDITYYLYSDEGLIGEYDESGIIKKEYGWLPDMVWGTAPVFMVENGQYYYYHNDTLGTPRKMTDSTGAVVWSADYTAYGKASVDASSTVTNNLRFPGQYFDEETGLCYNLKRYYDPDTGRYIQADPLGFAGGDSDLYTYVLNNPLNLYDPYGLSWLDWKGFDYLDYAVDPIVGFADKISFGCVSKFNDLLLEKVWGEEFRVVDKCSTGYMVGGIAGDIWWTVFGTAVTARGIQAVSKAAGPLKNWIRPGPSYSKALGRNIDMSIRWGASPAKKLKYVKQIKNKALRKLNQWLRSKRLPFGGWRSVDPGHFHLW